MKSVLKSLFSNLFPVTLCLLLAGCGPQETSGDNASSGMNGTAGSLSVQDHPDVAGAAEDGSIEIRDPWARPAAEGRMSAGYLTLHHSGGAADTLTGVSTDIARMAEIHESFEQEDGMTGMRHIEELPVPPQTALEFQPGGIHIMLMRLTRDLADGDQFELTLHFRNAGDITITVPVRS